MDRLFVRRLLAVLALGLLIFACINVRTIIPDDPKKVRADFDLYYYGAVAEKHGTYTDTSRVTELAEAHHRSVPVDGVFGAPAIVTFVFMPLTAFPIGIAELVWDVLTITLAVFAIRAAGKNAWPIYLIVMVITNPLLYAVRFGNASIITFSLVVFAYVSLRDGHSRRTGFLLGVATAFKFYPAFLIVVLVAGRKWRAVKVMIVTAIVLTLATVPFLGLHDSMLALSRAVSVAGTQRNWFDNDTFSAMVIWTTHNFALGTVVNVVGLCIAAGLILRRRDAPLHLTLAFATSLMLLTEAISWGHYYTLTFLLLVATFELATTTVLRVWTGVAFFFTGLEAVRWVNPQVPPGILKIAGLLLLIGCFLIAERAARLQPPTKYHGALTSPHEPEGVQ